MAMAIVILTPIIITVVIVGMLTGMAKDIMDGL